jgi:tRNA(Arg) A34 adenosine deaminase TadA
MAKDALNTKTRRGSLAAAHEAFLSAPLPKNANPRLVKYWGESVERLCTLEETVPAPSAAELGRHGIYARVLMGLVYHYWNGYKRGRPEGPNGGEYKWNDAWDAEHDPPAYNGNYFGHNIAAIAVDELGRILDFDFNHIDTFNSSAEHAETRLVRRLFSLANVNDAWNNWPRPPHTPTLQAPMADGRADGVEPHTAAASFGNITVYTTLEPCAQCAGVMTHAGVERVVYLQTDPGAVFTSRMLRNLTLGERLQAPLPIAGSELGLDCFRELNTAFNVFYEGVEKKPFFIPRDAAKKPDTSQSVTSFLCTGDARRIFKKWWGALRDESAVLDENKEVLKGARAFFTYASSAGRRATPHNL